MLSSNINVGRTANHTLTTYLPNLPDAQLVLECRLCKVDTTLNIATNFHSISWRISQDTTRRDENL